MAEIKVSLIKEMRSTKPTGQEIARLSNEIPHHSISLGLSDLKTFAEGVGSKGYTFSPATFKCGKRKKEYFEQQQFIALDFDSDKDNNIVTFEEINARAIKYELPILFAYETLTKHTPKRFRVVFLNDASITDRVIAESVLHAIAIIFPECDSTCSSDVSKMYFGGRDLIYFDDKIPTINIESLFKNLNSYWKEKCSYSRYISEIHRFSNKTGIVINENGLLDISVSYDPSESYDTTEQQAGASKLCDNNKFSPSTIIYTSDIIGYGENYRKYKIKLFDRQMSTSNCSVGRTAPSRTTANKTSKNHKRYRAITIKKMDKTCKLFNAFNAGKRDMEHQELFLLATNLINVESGISTFKKVLYEHSKYYDLERIKKWSNYLSYIKQQEYKPEYCSGNCPYDMECNHGKNILTTVSSKRGTVEKIPDFDERFSTLKEIEEDTFHAISEAFNTKDTAIHIIKSQTAAGKSTAYLKLMKENPNCVFLVAAPTNLLKDEIYNKAKKLGIPVKKTPSLDQIKDEMPVEVWNKIQKYYSRGQYNLVHPYISKILEQQDIPCLRKYMKEREELKQSTESIITTHRYLLTMEEYRLKGFDAIIIDEDIIFKSILTNQCGIPISQFKKMKENITNVLFVQKIHNLLKQAKKQSCIELDSFEWDEEDENDIIGKHPDLDIASFCMASKFYVRKKENELNLDEDTISFIKPVTFSPQIKYIMVSATVDEEICRNYFQNNNVVFYECKKARYKGTLFQYPQKSMSRASIASDPGIVKRLKLKFDFRDESIITFKSQNIGTLHFGNTEGSNSLEGKNILVIGTPYHADFLYKLAAFNMGIDFDEEEQMESCYVIHNGYRFRFTTFKDEELRKIHFWMIESELEQAVGRARLLRNSCEVHLFSNFILSQAEIVEDFDYKKK